MKYTLSFILLVIASVSYANVTSAFKTVTTNYPINTTEEKGKVINVIVEKTQDNYTFKVAVKSPDTGCAQYANWWEILTEEGELVYRRILAHSHISEQPFTRSGSVQGIKEDQELIVRVHMNNLGYGTQVFKGTVKTGFNKMFVSENFAIDLAKENPQPNPCRS